MMIMMCSGLTTLKDQTTGHCYSNLLMVYEIYGKCPKISTLYSILFFAQILLFMHLFLKISSGMAKSVDPDQTAPSGAV